MNKHLEVFGTLPEPRTDLEAVRARCCYRLQMEGHRQTATEPSDRFLQNYRALMRFDIKDPFGKCTPNVLDAATRLLTIEGRKVNMSTIKKVATKAKKIAKATPPTPPAPTAVIKAFPFKKVTKAPSKAPAAAAAAATDGKHHPIYQKLFGKYPQTVAAKWIVRKFDAKAGCVQAVLAALGMVVNYNTCAGARATAQKGDCPEIDSEDRVKIEVAYKAISQKATKK